MNTKVRVALAALLAACADLIDRVAYTKGVQCE